jgi:hypothetical protein
MPERGFPLPGSSYKELIKIIQGYGSVDDNATPSDVARVVSVHETIVSKNNRFLGSIGIIQGGKKKTMTPIGRDLAHALNHDIKDDIAAKWREIVETNDFLQKVVAAVRIRKGMDESTLESHVAYSAGQPKTPAVSTGAGTVVDILRAAELLKEEAGNLIAILPEQVSDSEEVGETALVSQKLRSPLVSGGLIHVSHYGGLRTEGVSLNIEVRIQCTAEDIGELGPKIRKLIKELNESEADDPSGSERGENS